VEREPGGQVFEEESTVTDGTPTGHSPAEHSPPGHSDVIYLSSDHAGCELRAQVAAHLTLSGYKVRDLGPTANESVDYPDFGAKLAEALRDDTRARGIAICGSGIGISIAVNRFSWARAALVSDPVAARLCRQHNDANVLALGERLIAPETALACVDAFLQTEFEGGRHQRRVDKLTELPK
jgi:ribose 5-phosphate isomerase B